MKKILKTTLFMVFLALVPGSLVQAQGLYNNKSQDSKSIYGQQTTQKTQGNGNPTLRAGIGDDGEPEGDAPVGEGILLLAVLAGAGCTVKRLRIRNYE